jgi:hypothetical protein
MIKRSGGTVCGLHRAHEGEKCGFLSSASQPRSTVCQWFDLKTTGTVSQWFDLKTTGTVFSGLASKPVVTVFSGLTSKPMAMVSSGLDSKPVLGFLVEPQNQGGGMFPDLCLKIKQALVCRLRHKTNVGRSAGDTCRDLMACFMWKQVWLGFFSLASRMVAVRGWMVHVTPSRRLRRSQVEDGRVDTTGYVGPCYSCFIVFILLRPMGIVVI